MNAFAASERIGIIGGGFSGVMTAVNLARLSPRPLDITIINQHRPWGRGQAYGTRRLEHLLNVAARNMSALPDLPDHFLRWLQTRSEYELVPEAELREKFIPRLVYGDYLRSLVQHNLLAPPETSRVRTRFLEAEALDARHVASGVEIDLTEGGIVLADRVVLATGNEPPGDLPGSAELRHHPAWVSNPWQPWEGRLPTPEGTILLLGTGLTTVDAVVTIRTLGWPGQIHAVSRNGWLPNAHFRGIDYPEFPPPGIDLAALGLKKLITLTEDHCARLRERGANPAIIVDKLRPHTQRIWQRFTREERLEVSRRHAARWNVLRHRIAPEIHAQISSAQLTGQLHLHAAAIEAVRADDAQIRVYLSGGESLAGNLVINATGPNPRFSATRLPFLQNLLKRGLIAPDELDLGVRVDADHTVLDPDGARSTVFVALGPLLKGTLWESVAVPELRGQARRAAESLLGQKSPPVEYEPADLMEYMI